MLSQWTNNLETSSKQLWFNFCRFRSLFLNSYKILAQGVDKRDDFRQVIHQTFEPLNRKWNDISDRLIM